MPISKAFGLHGQVIFLIYGTIIRKWNAAGGNKMQECKNAISHSLNAIYLIRECVLLLRKTNSKTHSLTELLIVVKCLVLFFPTIPQRCDKMINVELRQEMDC
jgi:hypothetical protein